MEFVVISQGIIFLSRNNAGIAVDNFLNLVSTTFFENSYKIRDWNVSSQKTLYLFENRIGRAHCALCCLDLIIIERYSTVVISCYASLAGTTSFEFCWSKTFTTDIVGRTAEPQMSLAVFCSAKWINRR